MLGSMLGSRAQVPMLHSFAWGKEKQSSRNTYVTCRERNREYLRLNGIARESVTATDCCFIRTLLLCGLSPIEARWISTVFSIVTQQRRPFPFARSSIRTISRTIS